MNNIFKKISLFNTYKRIINENSVELSARFQIKIDRASRLYTVINVPPEIVGEAYNLKKSDIDRISEGYLREYSIELAKFLDSKGLKELYDFYQVDKVDKNSYLMVFGSHKKNIFNCAKYTRNVNYILIPIVLASIISFLVIHFT
jgi:hypothetical protein